MTSPRGTRRRTSLKSRGDTPVRSVLADWDSGIWDLGFHPVPGVFGVPEQEGAFGFEIPLRSYLTRSHGLC